MKLKRKPAADASRTGRGLFSGFSLTFRLSLGITLLIMMLLGAVGFSSYLRDRDVFMKEAVSRGWTTVHAVQTFAGEHLALGHDDQLHKLIATLEKDPLISRAVILDRQGTIIVTNTPDLAGKKVNDPNVKAALETGSQHMGYLRNNQGQEYAVTFTAPLQDLAAESRGYFYLALDLGWVNAHLNDALNNILFNFVLASLAGLALTRLIIIRAVQRPVQAMVETTEKVSVGDFTGKLPVNSRDELGRLAQAFNDMNRHLGILFKLIQNTVADLNHTSATIVKHAQLIQDGDGKEGDQRHREEVLQEINSSARKLVRISDKLDSLVLQFKVETEDPQNN